MAESASGLILRMTRSFDATPDRVFAAWTDPEHFGSWFGPTGTKAVLCEVDPGRRRPAIDGRGQEIPGRRAASFAPPCRENISRSSRPIAGLHLAWHEKDDFAAARPETIVTIQFKPVGERTEMVFTQAVFKDEQALAAHNRG
jgi:uncharacterized protein YndB with AHSA1/START domain